MILWWRVLRVVLTSPLWASAMVLSCAAYFLYGAAMALLELRWRELGDNMEEWWGTWAW